MNKQQENQQSAPKYNETKAIKIEEVDNEKTLQLLAPVNKTLDDFIQSLPNEEMLLDDILTRYNEYFGTNVTKNKISQNKEFMSKFNKETRKVNRKNTNFYIYYYRGGRLR